jgi:hypothetical protein
MCNAWNHPLSCTCGFGGEGHLGRSGISQPIVIYDTRKLGFINPNARCPVCNAAVYFYQSPNGGRVFFDEIGPPWTKHPCTDILRPVTYARSINVPKVNTSTWKQFICYGIKKIEARSPAYQLEGLVDSERRTYYTGVHDLNIRAIYFVKEDSGKEQIELSTYQELDGVLGERHFFVKKYLSEVTGGILPLISKPRSRELKKLKEATNLDRLRKILTKGKKRK